jgi:uncharacterized Zn-finger protein
MPDAADTTPEQKINVKTRAVSCDGGEGVYGHPKVFLRIAGTEVMCPYCSKLFVLEPGVADHGH